MQNKILNKHSFLRRLSLGEHYKASRPGPRRLIFIAIHGNETCGVEAYLNIATHIPSLLQDGSLEVRLGNPLAFLLDQRGVDKDLNRSFNIQNAPKYETARCKSLVSSLLNAELFLDINSTSLPGPAFGLPGLYGQDLCNQLPVDLVIQGLAQTCQGTTLSIIDQNNLEGTVIECGQHKDESAIEVAKDCIYHFIKSQPSHQTNRIRKNQKVLRCPQSVVADDGFEFVKPIHFMQKFTKNELVARSKQKEFRCPYNHAFIIMPNSDPKAGEEAFYWGIE